MPLDGVLREANEAPIGGVVILHGLGDSGAGIGQIERYMRPYFSKDVLNKLFFAAPNAPFAIENGPGEWLDEGYAWFRIDWDLENNIRLLHPEDWQQSGQTLVAYLEALAQNQGVSLDKLVIIGFSQGAMMSLYSLDKLPVAPAGVAALAGRVLEPESIANAAHKPPVLLAHGSVDDVVTPDGSEDAYDQLKAAGYNVTHHVIEGRGHTDLFTDEILETLAEFIQTSLQP
jgi:phospholipase/carboxylesterase